MFVIYAWLISYFIIHVRATCDTPYRECPSDEVWHCQYDAETEYQVEFCAKAVTCYEGGRAVLHKETKSVSCEVCAEDMFQPEGKQSNDFTQPNCDDRVTPCNERQLVCEKATATENNKCACNYTAGYKPKQTSGCNCFSQDSTCECEKGTCEKGEILSPDYNCSSSKISSGATTTSNKGLIIGLSVGSVIFLLGVTVLILCCYKHRKCIEMGSNVTDNTEAKQPLTSQHPDSEMDKTDGEANSFKTDNNATPSDDPNSSKKSNGESNTEPKPPIGNTTTVGVSNDSNVGQANTASSVQGGQGHTVFKDCTVHFYPVKSKTAPLVDHNNL